GPPAVAADGQLIAFLYYSGGAPKIWGMTLDGKNVHPVTRGGGEFLPSFSPDSRTIYFSSGVPGFAGVWKIAADGGNPAQITRNRAVFSAVSPDGKYIAYRTDPPDGSAEVIVTPSTADDIVFRFP